MNLLIVAATSLEIMPLVQYLGKGAKTSNAATAYQYNSHTITVLITGVGMVSTTYELTKQLLHNHFDFILNLGIAGSFHTFSIGSVVNITRDCFAEMGAEDHDQFISVFDLKLIASDIKPYDNKWLLNKNLPNCDSMRALPTVKGITVNKVHGNSTTISFIQKEYNPHVESMEGAAFMYVCLSENIPFAQIRSISNYVEPRNKENWDIPLAITNLNNTAMSIIDDLCREAGTT